MTLLDYTFERRLELTARESRAEGYADGKTDGYADGKIDGAQNQLVVLVKKGLLSVSDAANEVCMTVEEFEKLMN